MYRILHIPTAKYVVRFSNYSQSHRVVVFSVVGEAYDYLSLGLSYRTVLTGGVVLSPAEEETSYEQHGIAIFSDFDWKPVNVTQFEVIEVDGV